jgi:hypothetical protein
VVAFEYCGRGGIFVFFVVGSRRRKMKSRPRLCFEGAVGRMLE